MSEKHPDKYWKYDREAGGTNYPIKMIMTTLLRMEGLVTGGNAKAQFDRLTNAQVAMSQDEWDSKLENWRSEVTKMKQELKEINEREAARLRDGNGDAESQGDEEMIEDD